VPLAIAYLVIPTSILLKIEIVFKLGVGKIKSVLMAAGLSSALWIIALALLYPTFLNLLVQISFGVSPSILAVF